MPLMRQSQLEALKSEKLLGLVEMSWSKQQSTCSTCRLAILAHLNVAKQQRQERFSIPLLWERPDFPLPKALLHQSGAVAKEALSLFHYLRFHIARSGGMSRCKRCDSASPNRQRRFGSFSRRVYIGAEKHSCAYCQDARQKSELKKLEDELQMLRPAKKNKAQVTWSPSRRCHAFLCVVAVVLAQAVWRVRPGQAAEPTALPFNSRLPGLEQSRGLVFFGDGGGIDRFKAQETCGGGSSASSLFGAGRSLLQRLAPRRLLNLCRRLALLWWHA